MIDYEKVDETVKDMIDGCVNLHEYRVILNKTIDDLKVTLLSNSSLENANILLGSYTSYLEEFREFSNKVRNIAGDNPHMDLKSNKRDFYSRLSHDSEIFEKLISDQKDTISRDKYRKYAYEYLMEEQRRVGTIKQSLLLLLGSDTNTECSGFFKIFMKVYNGKRTGDEVHDLFKELLS